MTPWGDWLWSSFAINLLVWCTEDKKTNLIMLIKLSVFQLRSWTMRVSREAIKTRKCGLLCSHSTTKKMLIWPRDFSMNVNSKKLLATRQVILFGKTTGSPWRSLAYSARSWSQDSVACQCVTPPWEEKILPKKMSSWRLSKEDLEYHFCENQGSFLMF